MMILRLALALAILASSAAASAEGLRDYCPDRPGIGTPPCIIDRNHISFEVGLADWMLERRGAQRTDTVTLADSLLRLGITDSAELQLGWASFGREHVRDRLTGSRMVERGIGDVTVAMRKNLRNPDGSGFSLAVMPFATIPVGHPPIGAGDWGAGLRVPMSYALNERFNVELVPEVDAAVDGDGRGRHLAYGSVEGIQAKLGKTVTLVAEYQLTRDADPAGSRTEQLGGFAVAWQPAAALQLDIGANAGLRHAPDVELYVGASRRF